MADSTHHKINDLSQDQRRKLVQQLRAKSPETVSARRDRSQEQKTQNDTRLANSVDTLIIGGELQA